MGNTYDLGKGPNTYCSRCHSPQNWDPAAEPDTPPNCVTCKFATDPELPIAKTMDFVEEEDWHGIYCDTCHIMENSFVTEGNAWFNPLTKEYDEVRTPVELPDHSLIQLGIVHSDYSCTQCHDAHSSQASCNSSGCHDQVLDPALGTPGHDADHANVDCFACHDASGMEVGPDPETGVWTVLDYKSHQIELAAPCEKCHFSGNAWGLCVVE